MRTTYLSGLETRTKGKADSERLLAACLSALNKMVCADGEDIHAECCGRTDSYEWIVIRANEDNACAARIDAQALDHSWRIEIVLAASGDDFAVEVLERCVASQDRSPINACTTLNRLTQVHDERWNHNGIIVSPKPVIIECGNVKDFTARYYAKKEEPVSSILVVFDRDQFARSVIERIYGMGRVFVVNDEITLSSLNEAGKSIFQKTQPKLYNGDVQVLVRSDAPRFRERRVLSSAVPGPALDSISRLSLHFQLECYKPAPAMSEARGLLRKRAEDRRQSEIIDALDLREKDNPLRNRVPQLEARTKELGNEVARLRDYNEALESELSLLRSKEEVADDVNLTESKGWKKALNKLSLADIVDMAAAPFGNYICLSGGARSSVDNAQLRAKAYEVVGKMGIACATLPPNKGLIDWLKESGLSPKPTSTTTMERFPKDYVVSFEDRRCELGWHINLSDKTRIYFALHPADPRRVLIGSVGEHKPIKTRS